ncbi:MAG: alanine racemase, partial [Eubacteriaceae bacterium]|nr:alanine racemase [Eubacteriaceae bacterium]
MRAKVTVRLGRIAQNLSALQKNCTLRGISLAAVTKVHAADPAVCGLIASFGVKALADSRIENLESMAALPAEKWLLRVPAPSIAGEVVRFSDLSLNSELSTIRILNREALKQKKLHKVALMWDLGDLREGYYRYADIEEAAREASSMPAIQFCGIATNLNCYGGVDPSVENMEALSEIASRLARSGMPCPIVSGGGSSTYSLLLNGTLPNGITNLRIGDTLYLGRDRLLLKKADGMNDDCFVLTAEVVEVKDKPSVPIGHIGLAALNATP